MATNFCVGIFNSVLFINQVIFASHCEDPVSLYWLLCIMHLQLVFQKCYRMNLTSGHLLCQMPLPLYLCDLMHLLYHSCLNLWLNSTGCWVCTVQFKLLCRIRRLSLIIIVATVYLFACSVWNLESTPSPLCRYTFWVARYWQYTLALGMGFVTQSILGIPNMCYLRNYNVECIDRNEF